MDLGQLEKQIDEAFSKDRAEQENLINEELTGGKDE